MVHCAGALCASCVCCGVRVVLCCAWGCLLNNIGLQVCLTLCRFKLLYGVSWVVVPAYDRCRAVPCCAVDVSCCAVLRCPQGLAALLVLGLSGCQPSEILSVQPGFIELLGLKQSLTPSRNNGFLNMFLKMQKLTLGLVVSVGLVLWVGGLVWCGRPCGEWVGVVSGFVRAASVGRVVQELNQGASIKGVWVGRQLSGSSGLIQVSQHIDCSIVQIEACELDSKCCSAVESQA